MSAAGAEGVVRRWTNEATSGCVIEELVRWQRSQEVREG